jgi:hypothetical protein
MLACPDCQNARAARALALDDQLWSNLVTLALPILIIVAVSLVLYRGGEPSQARGPLQRDHE